MAPNYRVQARNSGESWQTLSKYSGPEGAQREADRLAALRSSFWGLAERCPYYAFVRVVCGDQVIYTPSRTREAGA